MMTATATTPPTTVPSDISVAFSLWNQESKTTDEFFYLKVAQSVLSTGRLTDLRRIVAASPQQKDFATYTFCSDKGSVVPDSFLVTEYTAVLASQSGAASGTTAATNTGTTATKSPASATGVPSFFVRIPPSKADHVTAAQPVPDLSTIDTNLPTGSKLISAPDLIKLSSTYNSAVYTASAGQSNSTIAASLGEREWAIISQNTEALYGFTIDRSGTALTGTSSANFPAVRYKSREIPSYMITDSPINDTLISLRIPRFTIDDQSYVSCYQTTTSFQSSLAASSFSEMDVKAAVSGGAFGVQVGVSAGYGSSGSDASNTATATASDRMNIAYQFPRVTMRLDENCLELTDQCKTDLAAVTSKAALTKFLGMYGQFFATRLQLGGRLFASDETSTVSGSNASEKARSMKASAAVSFSSKYASGSVSFSSGSQNQSASTQSSASMTSTLTWQATGGDTLLCNNPAAWCPTVAPYYNWRVTKQDGVMHIIDLIGRMPGFSSVPAQLQALSGVGNQLINPPVAVADEIYLTYTASTKERCFLTCNDPSVDNCGICALHNSADYPSDGNAIFAAITTLSTVGAWSCRLAAVDSNLSGQWMKVENLDGSPVQQAKYETRYMLKSPSVGKYMGWVLSSTAKYPASSTYAAAVIFRNPDGSKSTAVVPTGAQVQLALCWGTGSDAAEQGLYGLILAGIPNCGAILGRNAVTFTLGRRG